MDNLLNNEYMAHLNNRKAGLLHLLEKEYQNV